MLIKTEIKITAQDYNNLLASSYAEISDFIEDIANKSAYPTAGYDFLFPNYFTRNGEFFVSWEHYDSCD